MKILEVDQSIYSKGTIYKAIGAYSHLTTIYVELSECAAVLCFQDCKFDEDRTVKEFENYMIGLENAK